MAENPPSVLDPFKCSFYPWCGSFLNLFHLFLLQYLMEYGPDYELGISAGNMKDINSKEYLQGIYRVLTGKIHNFYKLYCWDPKQEPC